LKITDIQTLILRAPLKEPWRIAKYEMKEMTCTLVKIFTDQGVVGVGECLTRLNPLATKSIVQEILKPILIDSNPFDVEVLWEKMFTTRRTRSQTKGFMIDNHAFTGVVLSKLKLCLFCFFLFL